MGKGLGIIFLVIGIGLFLYSFPLTNPSVENLDIISVVGIVLALIGVWTFRSRPRPTYHP